jgi:hypothetical protein
MNKLYHFGDSYSTVNLKNIENKHFCKIISEQIGYEYIPTGIGGMSNEWVLKKVLENVYNYVNGDIIFINFSFFERGRYYDYKKRSIESTNRFYNDIWKYFTMDLNDIDVKQRENISSLMEYFTNQTEDYARRIFDLFNVFLKEVDKKGVKLFYIFAGESDYEDELITVGTNIKFEGGFSDWLIKNGLHKDQDVHYTKGIQYILADAIFRKTKGLTETSSKIQITINDLDFTKKNKSNKII